MAKSDFLGIKNINWQFAATDLGAHALMLYLYLASNKNGYNLALSPSAVTEAIGMPRSTYHDQFKKLINKGYLVENKGNTYDFYELPQTRNADTKNSKTKTVLNFEEATSADNENKSAVCDISVGNIEINNTTYTQTDNKLINKEDDKIRVEDYIPKDVIVQYPYPKESLKRSLSFNYEQV